MSADATTSFGEFLDESRQCPKEFIASMSAKFKAAHDVLDAANVCNPDGTHPQLVERIKMLVLDRDNWKQCVFDEIKENGRLFEQLGFDPAKGEGPSTDQLLAKVREVISDRDTAQSAVATLIGEVGKLRGELDDCRKALGRKMERLEDYEAECIVCAVTSPKAAMVPMNSADGGYCWICDGCISRERVEQCKAKVELPAGDAGEDAADLCDAKARTGEETVTLDELRGEVDAG